MKNNDFKARLLSGEPQTGIWLGMASPYVAEMAGTAGFDWLLLDAEHAPNDVASLLTQLQAIAPYVSAPVVRPPVGDPVLIKRYLDIGVQNLLVPMVESAEQAAALVAAMRYPPEGVRGVGHVLSRAARWGQVEDYPHHANRQMCLLVQVETLQGLENLDAIAAVEGVDGVFIGPADLSAAMGHLGDLGHPDVVAAVDDGVQRIRAAGKAAGIVTTNEEEAQRYLDAGCTFVGVGVDTVLFVEALRGLAQRFETR
ncbi:4-hydroxy-2-oxoheptanedioate aldolase [Halomonas sp. ML-15]|uniref:4-hydroxy-2-oxoheptanedioate aldolase n=1 Tax=Halomonas sp. ML-15 TaxID=2773305 RepID=UPI001746D873|nr:4-hydroxy-2-oxoheptanedioate aldolase [Halomonas sp. ML-15]MBD3897812.1 4-hydroxy-2-oxoheptanedioate aldolase [Halomonas sp. ML-15]